MNIVKKTALCLLIWLAAAACATNTRNVPAETPVKAQNEQKPGNRAAVLPYTAIPETAPRWVNGLPAYNALTGNEYFWGFSGRFPTLREAVSAAEKDAKLRIAGTIAELIEGTYAETSVYKTSREQVIEDSEIVLIGLSSYTGGIIENVKLGDDNPATEDVYQKWYSNGTVEVQIIVNIARSMLENAGSRFREAISNDYSTRITTVNRASLSEAVRGYEDIRRSLAANPLHKAAAWFDLPQGRVNLYDYLVSQINSWGGSIIFDPIPGQKAGKGETVPIPVKVSSLAYISPGQIDYRISLSRVNSNAPALAYSVPGIDTSALPTGVYRGSVELRLSALSPILRDMTREFSLEVTLPPPPDKPFSPGPFGGRWNGVITYADQGRNYRDSYTLSAYADGSCWVTITAQDGTAQAALGYWSAENSIFHLDCDFENPDIPRLSLLHWSSVYDMQNNNRRLRLNIQPAPDYSGVVGLTLNREGL